jgi:hypothetical protein
VTRFFLVYAILILVAVTGMVIYVTMPTLESPETTGSSSPLHHLEANAQNKRQAPEAATDIVAPSQLASPALPIAPEGATAISRTTASDPGPTTPDEVQDDSVEKQALSETVQAIDTALPPHLATPALPVTPAQGTAVSGIGAPQPGPTIGDERQGELVQRPQRRGAAQLPAKRHSASTPTSVRRQSRPGAFASGRSAAPTVQRRPAPGRTEPARPALRLPQALVPSHASRNE